MKHPEYFLVGTILFYAAAYFADAINAMWFLILPLLYFYGQVVEKQVLDKLEKNKSNNDTSKSKPKEQTKQNVGNDRN